MNYTSIAKDLSRRLAWLLNHGPSSTLLDPSSPVNESLQDELHRMNEAYLFDSESRDQREGFPWIIGCFD